MWRPSLENAQGAHTLSSNSEAASTLSSNSASRPSLSAGSLMNGKIGSDSEKPVCSGNGVSCSIILGEPVIYLTGLDHDGTTNHSHTNASALLRGKLQLNITKSVKIKAVTIKFTGRARTEWPEGKPSYHELMINLTHARYSSCEV